MPIQHLEGQLDLVEWIDQQAKKDAAAEPIMNKCPTCGEEIRERREGVLMSPVKARIFDAIKRAGKDGIDGDDLFDLFLRERGGKRPVLKSHVNQINDRLAGTNCRIEVTRSATYRLKRTKVVSP